MVIFTYKDYIKQKEYDKALFGLWNTIQKNKNQEVYKSNLCVSVMEDKEEYILCSGEDIEEENKEKITKNKVNHEHDKIFRTVLSKKIDLAKFLNKFLSLKIKTEELEKYNNSYINQRFKNREADVVYRIKNQNIFLLIEHQTKIDKKMPIRLLEYSTEIMESAIEDKKYKTEPRVIPIVLYTGKAKWNVNEDTKVSQQLFEKVKIIDGKFNLIDINNFSEEELIEDDIFITKMMLVEKCKDTEKIAETLYKITKIIKEEDKTTFKKIIKEIWAEKIGTENTNKILKKIDEGDDSMLAVIEMIREENQRYINIGRKEGRKEGKVQQIQEIVQKMLNKKMTEDIIQEVTGLKKEEIDKIKQETL